VFRHAIRPQGKIWVPEGAAPGLAEAQLKDHAGEELAAM
jgi:hypothetical protein